jgi:hypothetical protein
MAGKMIDGFRGSRNVPDLLRSLSYFLDEMEFSYAEVRVPGANENSSVVNLKNWTESADGPFNCLYQWKQAAEQEGRAESGAEIQPKLMESRGLSTHFRLEFVFRIASLSDHPTLPFKDFPGSDIGRLTFYHPTTVHLPVSAVCLLSRQVWNEFEGAINRIVAQSIAGLREDQADRGAAKSRGTRLTAVIKWRPLGWTAPIINRITGSQNRR